MADRYINWPPPKEALIPLVKAIARVMAERDFAAAKEARRRELTEANASEVLTTSLDRQSQMP